MGAQRTPEVTMFALLFFLLLGVVVLLAAAGRIWVDAPPLDLQAIDGARVTHPTEPVTIGQIRSDQDHVV